MELRKDISGLWIFQERPPNTGSCKLPQVAEERFSFASCGELVVSPPKPYEISPPTSVRPSPKRNERRRVCRSIEIGPVFPDIRCDAAVELGAGAFLLFLERRQYRELLRCTYYTHVAGLLTNGVIEKCAPLGGSSNNETSANFPGPGGWLNYLERGGERE